MLSTSDFTTMTATTTYGEVALAVTASTGTAGHIPALTIPATEAMVKSWEICLENARERRALLETENSRRVLGANWQIGFDLADAKVKRYEGYLAEAKAQLEAKTAPIAPAAPKKRIKDMTFPERCANAYDRAADWVIWPVDEADPQNGVYMLTQTHHKATARYDAGEISLEDVPAPYQVDTFHCSCMSDQALCPHVIVFRHIYIRSNQHILDHIDRTVRYAAAAAAQQIAEEKHRAAQAAPVRSVLAMRRDDFEN